MRDGFLDLKNTSRSLRSRFVVPPFSVIDTKQGDWQKRKRQWLSLGIKSELGRKNDHETNTSMKMSAGTAEEIKQRIQSSGSGTSVFDPVLCEVMYKWFCPPQGQIIDCFAGGSVRGVVAHVLGFNYWGCELRQEQVDANIKQGRFICNKPPTWVQGDSKVSMRQAPPADFLFTCPPYGDLEVYSEDPADISNMTLDDFLDSYYAIIRRSCLKLKEDRFAGIVVGEYRDKKGNYCHFVPETINAFKEAGLSYYNEIIYETAIGSLPIRTSKQFDAGRKVGKMHQNVLVFCKGDWKKATENIVKGG